jgi:hypothetical protein
MQGGLNNINKGNGSGGTGSGFWTRKLQNLVEIKVILVEV